MFFCAFIPSHTCPLPSLFLLLDPKLLECEEHQYSSALWRHRLLDNVSTFSPNEPQISLAACFVFPFLFIIPLIHMFYISISWPFIAKLFPVEHFLWLFSPPSSTKAPFNNFISPFHDSSRGFLSAVEEEKVLQVLI